VSELLDPTTGFWDEVLVRDICYAQDIYIILSIPVYTDCEDNEKGLFSVKSAYRLQRQLTDLQDGQRQEPNQGHGLIRGTFGRQSALRKFVSSFGALLTTIFPIG
jgi:hypothetical protein